ncbi:sensor histidine kinase [Allorhizocola rhizosphaerae]|uniref:sensor histidine kinase n=1 Tax=Allorhizocola rhizosphaerae TaxID=1872709 RepID=UPI000E3BE8AD|nr:nitrate- and nitrite sensing domain-containing protein [Allorhizocola rhizosphaerae]
MASKGGGPKGQAGGKSNSRHQRLTVVSHRRPSATRPRDWRVPVKLGAVLLIPLFSFLVIAGIQVASSVATASTLDKFARHVSLGRQVTHLVHELQRERDRTTGMLASLSAHPAPARDVSSLSPDWTAVDRAAEDLRAAVRPLLDDQAMAGAFAQAEALLAQVPQIRAGATQGWLRAQAAFETYTRAIASLQALLPAPLEVGGDPTAARMVRGYTYLSLAKELTAQIRGHLYMVCSVGSFAPGEFERIADVRAEAQSAFERFREGADQRQLARFDDEVTGQAVSNASRLLQTIIGNARAAELGVDAQQWWLASTTQLELMRAVEQTLLENATAGVLAASESQWRSTILGTVATLTLLMVTMLATVVIGRGMATSLRSLREQALQVAQQKLPNVIQQLRASPTTAPRLRVDPIVVHARDEVGEVAEAFTAVHRSAVRLAAEQALMRRNVNDILIKLARRSQTLVERQLRLLDKMESTETNPEQLANLFRLDHLATRLRRNDENLLVLAEGDSSRGQDQPVDLSTVVLAATAEIEHYPRVRQEVHDSVYIVGYAITDLVHLIAELLENATNFSPPDTTVQLTAQSEPDGGAEIIITDSGIGMASEAIADANRQLAAPMSIDISSAERMGLVVVGHLARRHDIRVTLAARTPGAHAVPADDAPVKGVIVTIWIPPKLVTEASTEPAPTVDAVRWLQPDGSPSQDQPADGQAQPARPVRVRAEDLLRPAGGSKKSVWWSRDAEGSNGMAQPARPEETQAAAVFTEAGLPKRTRTEKRTATVVIEAVAPEADPDATESMLTSFYSGVRRADTESARG